ncbi:hypothetical protein GCM10023219_11460 [Stakelama sediminis]|uniref:Membrane-bound inhibitor of C-type lysozyme n=1 Tax=Stakelama sediminis TaxID=463200 RepID=A0A840YWD5_9SPHN|nr:MliC family protein [Stakelama sediminis]MBB5717870.1 membrane-bound inhibitor of C-type lysozyme [Stakelama sediminis]
MKLSAARYALPTLTLALLLSGCGGSKTTPAANMATTNTVDTATPTAAPTATPEPDGPEPNGIVTATPVPTPSPTATPAPAPGASPTPTAEVSAQDAVNVIRRYFTLLANHEYRDAYLLWDHGGKSSGMSEEAFAKAQRKFDSVNAELGPPSRIDAGAGQRHITIPVTVHGKLSAGGPYRLVGQMTLHHTADIPGTTMADRSWHISASELNPRPQTGSQDQGSSTPPEQPQTVAARFSCVDGSKLRVVFDNSNQTAMVFRGKQRIAKLDQQESGSGIRYGAQGYELRGKGKQIAFSTPNTPPLPCTQIGK